MSISYYNLSKQLKNAEDRHRAFFYHYFTSEKEKFEAAVERWKGKNHELKEALEAILENDFNWYQNELFNNEKNLSGSEFKEVEINKTLEAFSFTELNFTSFESCNFIGEYADSPNSSVTVFLECKLNHVIFKNCNFENISFLGGVFRNIVFYNCTFKNVGFNRLKDGNYKNLFFQNCNFESVDLSKLEMISCCFWGDCIFDKLLLSDESFPDKKVVGAEILYMCKQWDIETFEQRKQNKYIGGAYNKLEIVYFKEGEEEQKIIKYSSLNNCYQGLRTLYKYLYVFEDKFGDHIRYLNYSYLYKWIEDQMGINFFGLLRYKNIFISRYILGYGVKFLRPLITFISMDLVFATCYLFSGVNTPIGPIKRPFSFNAEEFIGTLWDYFRCIYYGIITSTSTGYGEITPANGTSMIFAGLHAVLGVLMLTMFTVIFGRRYFK